MTETSLLSAISFREHCQHQVATERGTFWRCQRKTSGASDRWVGEQQSIVQPNIPRSTTLQPLVEASRGCRSEWSTEGPSAPATSTPTEYLPDGTTPKTSVHGSFSRVGFATYRDRDRGQTARVCRIPTSGRRDPWKSEPRPNSTQVNFDASPYLS